MNDEAFSSGRAWQVTQHRSKCPMAHNVISHYTNKRAVTGIDDEMFGTTVSGSGGSDGGVYSFMNEATFIPHRMPIRNVSNAGHEAFGNKFQDRINVPVRNTCSGKSFFSNKMPGPSPHNLSTNYKNSFFLNYT